MVSTLHYGIMVPSLVHFIVSQEHHQTQLHQPGSNIRRKYFRMFQATALNLKLKKKTL